MTGLITSCILRTENRMITVTVSLWKRGILLITGLQERILNSFDWRIVWKIR